MYTERDKKRKLYIFQPSYCLVAIYERIFARYICTKYKQLYIDKISMHARTHTLYKNQDKTMHTYESLPT